MSPADLAKAFMERCEADRQQLVEELRSYEPLGAMRLWKGRSKERLHEITEERVDAIQRELARVDAAIELAAAIGKVL
jgi:hypothetical protein